MASCENDSRSLTYCYRISIHRRTASQIRHAPPIDVTLRQSSLERTPNPNSSCLIFISTTSTASYRFQRLTGITRDSGKQTKLHDLFGNHCTTAINSGNCRDPAVRRQPLSLLSPFSSVASSAVRHSKRERYQIGATMGAQCRGNGFWRSRKCRSCSRGTFSTKPPAFSRLLLSVSLKISQLR